MNPIISKIIDYFIHQVATKPNAKELEILEKAVTSSENIVVFRVDAVGRWVRSGSTDFVSNTDNAVAATYLDALDGLKQKGLVRQESIESRSSLQTYSVTGRGHEIIRKKSSK